MARVSQEVLTNTIKDILESADLNVMTSKLVRNELKNRLKIDDIDSYKKQINDIINDVIYNLSQKNHKKSKDKISDNINNRKLKDNVVDTKTNEKSDSSSDSDIEDDINKKDKKNITKNDEEFARKLNEEEMTSTRRVTRNSLKPQKKRKTVKKKEKKDNCDEDKSEKKRNTNKGYLKKCVLSTELAHFLGQQEMARYEVVKRIWSYVKDNNLQDPKNKQFAIPDNQLTPIFGSKKFLLFGMMKQLTKHIN
ncbi:uncharacterized protein LOC128957843 isoform X2 [Oppia nitens]|uniref:uncharacterized protein LOC128957843 isoform X2 n=1 Tax=Oppia nitens TaxID=1686743 RepID=UPI0023DB93C2|nr:uncharacterized protein LOC128957843 isoform X2 [Oppia nitens]